MGHQPEQIGLVLIVETPNKFFFDYFRARIEFVENFCLDRIEGLILMCCYIDALAKYRYGRHGGNYERFQTFILGYSDFQDIWKKISLPLLKYHFEERDNDYYSDLLRNYSPLPLNNALSQQHIYHS